MSVEATILAGLATNPSVISGVKADPAGAAKVAAKAIELADALKATMPEPAPKPKAEPATSRGRK
jgi:hypothetical protein